MLLIYDKTAIISVSLSSFSYTGILFLYFLPIISSIPYLVIKKDIDLSGAIYDLFYREVALVSNLLGLVGANLIDLLNWLRDRMRNNQNIQSDLVM